MHINGISHVHAAQPVNQPHHSTTTQPAASQGFDAVDKLDISSNASYVSQVREAPEIRADRVAEIRAAIADGAYETDEKLDFALEALLDEIGG